MNTHTYTHTYGLFSKKKKLTRKHQESLKLLLYSCIVAKKSLQLFHATELQNQGA